MKGKIKISAVSYLNSTPFVYGIRKKLDPALFSLELDIPAVCAEKLLAGNVHLGLVPVAVIPSLSAKSGEAHIISDFCIGAEGRVRSVMLYSQVPLTEIKKVLLDHQSRTSVMLTRVLAKEHWKIAPQWENAQPGFETSIRGTTAGVVIGDRTFAMEGTFPYVYDLSEEWWALTGLPFVFACWVSNCVLSPEFTMLFNEALRFGLDNRTEMIAGLDHLPAPRQVISDYLHHSISYGLDEPKKKGLQLFLEKCASL
jgi:chorismate dehydratase